MKRIFFVLLMLLGLTTVQSQEKGLYLTIDGGLGWTNFNYKLNQGSNAGRLGYGGSLGAQYYWNRHWGVSLTGEFYVYNTQSRYSNKPFLFKDQVDDEGDLNDLTVRLKGWKENQTTYFVEIPLMLRYQHKFGQAQKHGLYFGIGAKAQLPIQSTYERHKGSVITYANYPEWNLPLGEEGKSQDVTHHGYGTNGKRAWSGDNELKSVGFAGVAEVGALFGLSRRVDLTLGVSADYTFTDMKEKNDNFIGPVENTTQQGGTYIAENVYYNGVLNSTEIDKNNPFSIRGKIGLRIKLGKLAEKEEEPETIVEIPITDTIRDTVVVEKIIEKEVVPQIVKEEPATDEDGFTADERNLLQERIFFDLNSAVLTPASKMVLDRKVAMLKRHPDVKVRILGNTCDLGNQKINVPLGLRRANAARNYMIEKGIDASRFITATQSSSDPLLPNTEEENRAMNRRCDFEVDRNR